MNSKGRLNLRGAYAAALPLAAAFVLPDTPAHAAEPGLYATANVGAGFLVSETQTYGDGTTTTSASVDFDTLPSNPDLDLYAGIGLVYLQEIDIDFEAGGRETSFETDDIAFQLKFGGRYDLSDRWFIEGGAAYLAASGIEMEFPADRSQTIESDYNHWSASLGIGWRF